MSLLRAFLLWALMVAVPFQAHAAVSMLRCGPGAAADARQADAGTWHMQDAQHAHRLDRGVLAGSSSRVDRAGHAGQAGHEGREGHEGHEGHDWRADHGVHGSHAVQAEHGDDAVPIGYHAHPHDASTPAHDEVGHACSTCGVCHAVALIGLLPPLVAAALPPADLGEPAPAVATRTPRVPDKPPRG